MKLPINEIRQLSAIKDAKLHDAVATFFKINKVNPKSIDEFSNMILDMINEAGEAQGMDERALLKIRLHLARLFRSKI